MRHITCEYVTKNWQPCMDRFTGSVLRSSGPPPPPHPTPRQLELVILSSSKVRTKACIPASHSRTASSFSPQKSALFFLLFRSWEEEAGPEPLPPLFSVRVAGPVGVCRAELGPGCGSRSLGLGVWSTGRGAECSEISRSRSLRKGVLEGRRQRSPAAVVPQAGEMTECGASGAEARAARASLLGLFVLRRMGIMSALKGLLEKSEVHAVPGLLDGSAG